MFPDWLKKFGLPADKMRGAAFMEVKRTDGSNKENVKEDQRDCDKRV